MLKRIYESFTSIQGEGMRAGSPAHFVRFRGCPIHCEFCDTEHIWAEVQDEDYHAELMGIVENFKQAYPNVRHIVFTGGEPLYNNERLVPILYECMKLGWVVQIETSGTYSSTAFNEFLSEYGKSANFHLTISPKAKNWRTDASYLPLADNLITYASELKFVVGSECDIKKRIPAFFAKYTMSNTAKVYLQPIKYDSIEFNTAQHLCVQTAIANGWNVSCQIHKVFDVR